MRILLPAYDLNIARRGRGVAKMILNPHSGPGVRELPGWRDIFKKQEDLAYIDLIAWPGDSPLYKVTRARVKTLDEVLSEAKRYEKYYGHKAGFFFDDATPSTRGLWRNIALLPGELVLNPGCPTPGIPSNFISIQHEGPGVPKLSAEGREKVGVMCLGLPEEKLRQAAEAARGCAYFFAHDKTDDWENGKSCYNKFPKYWGKMLTL